MPQRLRKHVTPKIAAQPETAICACQSVCRLELCRAADIGIPAEFT
jgi:hypothetical protein